MTTLPAQAGRRVVLLLKSTKIAHQAGYYLLNGRWHSVKQDKPAPKGVPKAAHPVAAGKHAPVKLAPEQIDALKYPADKAASNKEMAAFNDVHLPKLLAHAENGDATAILGHGYGSNTHGKKQAKIANYLLGEMGSEHKVEAGQKAGEHHAVKQVPAAPVEAPPVQAAAPEPVAEPAAAPESAAKNPAMPAFIEGKTTSGVVSYYENQAQKVLDMAAAGDVAGLVAMKEAGLKPNGKGKVSNTWAGKTANSKMLLELHAASLQQAVGKPAVEAAAPVAEPTPAEKVKQATQAAAVSVADEPSLKEAVSIAEKVTGAASKLAQIPWDSLLLPDSNSNAKSHNGKVAQIKAMAEAGDIAGLEAFKAGKNTYGKKQNLLAQTALAALKEDAPAAEQPAQPAESAPAAEEGPKDGDTKPGADGKTLVFKDGRWHKQVATDEHGEMPPTLVPVEDEPAKAELSDRQKAAKIAAYLTSKGADSEQHAEGKALFDALPAEQQHAITMAAINAEATAASGSKAKKPAKKAKTKVTASAAPAAIPSMDDWKKIGNQQGSNPGGKFVDEHGTEWYCKFPGNEDVAKSEVLAAKLYGAAGIAGQDAMLVTKDGKLGIASKWQDVKKAASPAALAKVEGVASGFAADAWLGNWDVVGLGYDNLQVGADGKAMRVDAGGSLEYRAQGGKKAFGNIVTELDSLRDPKINPQSAAVFGKLTKADITASVAKVLKVDDAEIHALVDMYGPGDAEHKKALAETLIARKADLLAKFPKAAKAVKKRLDPTSLPVPENRLPPAHDFNNWLNSGKPLSSQAHVNAANANVEKEMIALAKTGNLVALKEFQFAAINKANGEPTGQTIPITQHPSKHVVQMHADLVQMLDEIANPPQPLKIFNETDVGTLDELASAFPSKAFGTTVASVHSNEKLGFWVVLGGTTGANKFKPAVVKDFSTAMVSAGYAKFKECVGLAKHFIHSVQASGSYNDLFREGKKKDHSGNLLSDVAKAAEAYATSHDEGTTLYRWQNMPEDMVKKIMTAPDGTVFQATGPMCTSYHPTATAGFGQHRVVFRYAKGAKAVESFGSGSFAGEKEVTTLPNSRFVILSKKMVPSEKNPSKKRLELEVLMLPPDLGL